jgi:hypothetical protein
MKNLFIGFLMLVGSASFANENLSNDKTISKTSLEIKSKDKTEKVLTSCSFSGGGVTITVNCECTGAVCRKVLAKIVAEL